MTVQFVADCREGCGTLRLVQQKNDHWMAKPAVRLRCGECGQTEFAEQVDSIKDRAEVTG